MIEIGVALGALLLGSLWLLERRERRRADECFMERTRELREVRGAAKRADEEFARAVCQADAQREELTQAAQQATALLARAAEQLDAAEKRCARQFGAIERIEAQRDVANENYHRAALGMSAAQDMMVREISLLARRVRMIDQLAARIAGEKDLAKVKELAGGVAELCGRSHRLADLERLRDEYKLEHEKRSSDAHIEERVGELLHERRTFGLDETSRTPAA